MSGYIGPIPVPQGIQNKESFTATAAQTTFNTNGYTDGAFISVYLNGVRLVNGTDYTATNGSDVVLASAANTGDVLDFESFNSFSLASQQFENITTKNPTHEDTDGGRESAISFQGEQSGGEISTLAAIQASHDGTADDQKGDLIFKTNDGSDNNAPTEAMRIQSDQKIGIGTDTPDPDYTFTVSGAIPATITTTSTATTATYGGLAVKRETNTNGNGTGIAFVLEDAGDVSTEYSYIGGLIESNTAGSEDGGMILATTLNNTRTERMRIDSSGNVGINTSSPLSTLQVRDSGSSNGSFRVGGNGAALGLELRYDQSGYTTSIIQANPTYTNSNQLLKIRCDGDLNTDQLVLTGGNAVLMGTSTVQGQGHSFTFGSGYPQYNIVSGATSSLQVVQFRNPNGKIGTIVMDGSNTAYNTSSDYRLKENVETLSGAITRVKALKPKRFSWIADEEDSATVDGFLAHEAATVVPEAVTGTKDEVEVWADGDELPDGVSVGDNKLDDDGNTIPEIQGIDQSKIVPLLTAALQEAIAKIETLESENTAIKARLDALEAE